MEFYHYFLIFIKAIVALQFVFIFLKYESPEDNIFIVTDSIFKICLAIFIISYFFLLNTNAIINIHEKSFFVAAGLLLLLDVDYKRIYSIINGSK